MKKISMMVLCGLLSAGLIGCSNNNDKAKEAAKSDTAQAAGGADTEKKAKSDDKDEAKKARKEARAKRKAEREAFRPVATAFCEWEIACKATGMEGMTLQQCVSTEMMGSRCIPQRTAYYQCAVKTPCDDQETCKELSTAYGNCQVGKE